MLKIILLFSLIHIIISNGKIQNKTLKNKTNFFTHSFCQRSENSFYCKHPLILILGIFLALIAVIIGSYIYMKYFFDERTSFMRIWENYINQRLAFERLQKLKEKEFLVKKKKYYLLNNEIKGFKYKKENCNNEEECPICLENYSDEKKVCFTPCKHLFHHICLKEYIYGCDEMKCPICKFDMWNCLKDKKINYSKIKIKEEIFQIKKNSKKNKNNLINSNNVTLNNERDSLNIS